MNRELKPQSFKKIANPKEICSSLLALPAQQISTRMTIISNDSGYYSLNSLISSSFSSISSSSFGLKTKNNELKLRCSLQRNSYLGHELKFYEIKWKTASFSHRKLKTYQVFTLEPIRSRKHLQNYVDNGLKEAIFTTKCCVQ